VRQLRNTTKGSFSSKEKIMSDATGVKDHLKKVRGSPLKVPGNHPKYKEEYSEVVWALVDRVVEDHDRLERHTEALQGTVKLLVNQTQNAMAETKRIAQELHQTAMAFRGLKAPPSEEASSEVDLKGE
jgi:hypothetical protein